MLPIFPWIGKENRKAKKRKILPENVCHLSKNTSILILDFNFKSHLICWNFRICGGMGGVVLTLNVNDTCDVWIGRIIYSIIMRGSIYLILICVGRVDFFPKLKGLIFNSKSNAGENISLIKAIESLFIPLFVRKN